MSINTEVWFLIGLAVPAFLISWWYVAGVLAHALAYGTPDGYELGLSIGLGFLLVPIAPILFIGRLIRARQSTRDFVLRFVYNPNKSNIR